MINPEQVSRIAIVGAGTIGASWTALYLAQGYEIAVYDTLPGIPALVQSMIDGAWPALTKLGIAKGKPALSKLRFVATVAEAVSNADFIQESGPENPKLKGPLLAEVDAHTPKDVVIASSTSGLTLETLRSTMTNKGRIVIGHPFNPPHLLPLVEVVADSETPDEIRDWTMAFYRKAGKAPIHLTRSVPGHIANRLQAAIWREAIHLVNEGVASLADVDAACALGPGLRWAIFGPNTMFHLGGGAAGLQGFIDKLGPSFESYWRDLGQPWLTPDVVAKLNEGLKDLPDRDALLAERDRKLVDILAITKPGQ